jgi:hypothetical protein
MAPPDMILTVTIARRQEPRHFPSLINLDMPFCGDPIEEAFHLVAAGGPYDPHGIPDFEPV